MIYYYPMLSCCYIAIYSTILCTNNHNEARRLLPKKVWRPGAACNALLRYKLNSDFKLNSITSRNRCLISDPLFYVNLTLKQLQPLFNCDVTDPISQWTHGNIKAVTSLAITTYMLSVSASFRKRTVGYMLSYGRVVRVHSGLHSLLYNECSSCLVACQNE